MISLETRRTIHNAKLFFRYHFGSRSNARLVFVISAARSGSTLLLSYLRVVPSIKVPGEVLNPWIFIGPRRIGLTRRRALRHIKYSAQTASEVCVVKCLKEQLELAHLTVDDLVDAFPEANFIVLYRSDVGRQFVSFEHARVSNEWFAKQEPKKISKIHVDPNAFEAYFTAMANYYNSVLSSKRIREQCLVLEYENLAQNAQGLFDALVFDFLNVSPIHVSSQLRKQNPGELSESVENYDEVRELLERKLQLKTEANKAL